MHGVILFPRWVEVVGEFAQITFLEDSGADDDTVINCPPSDLPAGYTARTN